MDLLEFWTICSANGIVFDKEQAHSLERYHNELLYWNEKVNMISRKDTENIYIRHILHSLTIFKYIDFPLKAKCLDVGTGGGLPGIPLKIVRPDIHMVLIDSIGKKIKMSSMFAQHTGLKNIFAVNGRAEELDSNPTLPGEVRKYLGNFDFIVSRAVAPISELINWTGNQIKSGGKFIFLKGGDLTDEIAEAKQFYKNLVIKEQSISLFGLDWFKEEEKKIVVCEFVR